MPNLNYLHLLPMTLAVVSATTWAQAPASLTVSDVLRQQQAALSPTPVLKIERAKTTRITLDAVYGLSDQLKFDLNINGLAKDGLAIGDTVKGGTGSCKLVSYSAASQCLQLSQGTRAETCPPQACWTGVRASAILMPPPLPATAPATAPATVIPAISSLPPLPLRPVGAKP